LRLPNLSPARSEGRRSAEPAAKALPGLVADQLPRLLQDQLGGKEVSPEVKKAALPVQAALREGQARRDGKVLHAGASLKDAPKAIAAILALAPGE
jgi:hypothetical protein